MERGEEGAPFCTKQFTHLVFWLFLFLGEGPVWIGGGGRNMWRIGCAQVSPPSFKSKEEQGGVGGQEMIPLSPKHHVARF